MNPRASAPDVAMQAFAPAQPFGEDASDLELDFAAGHRPELVTRLLCGCLRNYGGTPSAAEVWAWTLHRRLQALVAIERTSGGARAEVQVRCPHAGCGESMALDVELERFVLPDQAPDFDVDVAPDVRLTMRLPTGADQLHWQATGWTDDDIERRLARDLVRSVNGAPLADEAQLAPEWLEPLAEALEQRDPLTALHLNTRCPACGEAVTVEFDLEAHLLARAAARQARLLDAVHRLARAYHWSEREILALPRSRREQYLARVRAEEFA